MPRQVAIQITCDTTLSHESSWKTVWRAPRADTLSYLDVDLILKNIRTYPAQYLNPTAFRVVEVYAIDPECVVLVDRQARL